MEKRLAEVEESKTDMENKWIQERLKHHQTIGDSQKTNEKLKEVEKNLEDEMENHRASIEKMEAYKKRIAELEKKGLHYKKTIKNLSQQILDLHNNIKGSHRHVIQEEPEESSPSPQGGTQKTWENQEDELRDDETVREAMEKAETITNQISKIHELRHNLEEATNEISRLKKANEDLVNVRSFCCSNFLKRNRRRMNMH